MHFINKIFPTHHHKSSFQIEDVSGSEEEDIENENEIEDVPRVHKLNFGQLRKKPLAKMGQADFLSRYDANFDDVFGENPNPLILKKQDEDQSEASGKPKKMTKKKEKKPTTPKEPKEPKQPKEQKETIQKQIKEPNEFREPKQQKEPRPPRIKLPRQRKRTPKNHLSTIKESEEKESIHSARESAQPSKFNPNSIALPQTEIPKSEKKTEKQKVMLFTFGADEESVNTKKEKRNSEQSQRKQRPPRKIEKSPSPTKRVQIQRPKRKTQSVDPLEVLNIDELTLNPHIAPCTPNLYLDYKPVYD